MILKWALCSYAEYLLKSQLVHAFGDVNIRKELNFALRPLVSDPNNLLHEAGTTYNDSNLI
jgi:iron complex outermembrane receptor protein